MKPPETSISQARVAGESGVRAHEQDKRHRHGHRWMMIACCVPMLAIAIALAVAGVVGPLFIVVAVTCTAMMAVMMGGMSHGSDHGANDSVPAKYDGMNRP